MQKLPGKLFVIEGPDGVGKTTIAKLLVDALSTQGCDVMYFSFPGREVGTLGAHVYELHHEPNKFGLTRVDPMSLQLLHIASHIDAIETCITPAIRAGKTVILDRFWWSTHVYGKQSGVNQRALTLAIQAEQEYWESIVPDAIFLITRIKPIREEYSKEKWERLQAIYYELAQKERRNQSVYLVENSGTQDETLTKILDILARNPSPPESGTTNSGESQNEKQLRFDLFELGSSGQGTKDSPTLLSRLAPTIPSEVFDTYWKFAAERQEIFFRRYSHSPPPWTNDPILQHYKFTNAYRASDRVSQFLIRNVIYQGEQSPNELFFRIMLFKFFNRIETWKLLKEKLGEVSLQEYDFEKYDRILIDASEHGETIFSAAYIMPSGSSSFGYSRKHRNFLKLLEKMIAESVPLQLAESRTMRAAFELLRSYPLMGDFLAYQYITDINYSGLTNFSEMEFVIPGPGARDGIHKCFKSLGGLNESDIIRFVTDRQEAEFERLGIDFRFLWGRPLQLIDCQNLFCEVDKYARVAHPSIKGRSERTRIKQSYRESKEDLKLWYPPKWGINHLI